MPSVIPYDPTLVLGNIVSQAKLDVLLAISALQAPVDAAEDTLNSYIAMKRSLDMTIQEMINMAIDPIDVVKESAEVGKQIKEAAVAYAKLKVETEKKTQPLRAKIQSISSDMESPIDYVKSEIKQLPLSSDSLKMNCQYFAFDENEQDSATHAAAIGQFVNDSVSAGFDGFSGSYANQAKTAAQSQMNSQHARHDISGTLVVSITCTHKNAAVFEPLHIDPDRAIGVWNKLFPTDKIKVSDPTSVTNALNGTGPAQHSFTILSGATYGSCFIGMVHILNTTDTTSSEEMYSLAESLQEQASVGSWWQNVSGGFGVSSSFSQDAKNLLSAQNITAHCTLIALGAIPSIKSNQVAMAVKGFTDDDGAKSMAALQKLQNATSDDMTTIDSAANAARTGQQLISMQTAKVQAALSGLADIDNNSNKVIDTNSMMDALDDYITKCAAGNMGVPINFYLKAITKPQLAKLWLMKYYPNKFSQNASNADANAQPSGQ